MKITIRMPTGSGLRQNNYAVSFCEECGQEYATLQYAKICPNCGSEHTYLARGNEFLIKEIEVYSRGNEQSGRACTDS